MMTMPILIERIDRQDRADDEGGNRNDNVHRQEALQDQVGVAHRRQHVSPPSLQANRRDDEAQRALGDERHQFLGVHGVTSLALKWSDPGDYPQDRDQSYKKQQDRDDHR